MSIYCEALTAVAGVVPTSGTRDAHADDKRCSDMLLAVSDGSPIYSCTGRTREK